MTIASPPITVQDLLAIGVSDLFGQHTRKNDFARASRVPKQVPEKCVTLFRQKPATKQQAKQAKRGRSHASLLSDERAIIAAEKPPHQKHRPVQKGHPSEQRRHRLSKNWFVHWTHQNRKLHKCMYLSGLYDSLPKRKPPYTGGFRPTSELETRARTRWRRRLQPAEDRGGRGRPPPGNRMIQSNRNLL